MSQQPGPHGTKAYNMNIYLCGKTTCSQRKLVDFYWSWRRVSWDGRATRPGPWPERPTRPICIRSYNLTSLNLTLPPFWLETKTPQTQQGGGGATPASKSCKTQANSKQKHKQTAALLRLTNISSSELRH